MKIKKYLSAILSVTTLFITFTSPIAAYGAISHEDEYELVSEDMLNEILDDDTFEIFKETGEIEVFPVQINETDTLHFFSEEDRDLFLEANNPHSRLPMQTTRTVLSTVTRRNQFLGFNSLTPNWSYASQYTISRNRSFSASTSHSFDGITANLSVSVTQGVAITIPANSRNQSRLGINGDIVIDSVRLDWWSTSPNNITRTQRVLQTRSTSNLVNVVRYR